MGIPSVCVVMSTYNGEKYIKDQIESICNQDGVAVTLFIRDDGSSDRTIDIIKSMNIENLILETGKNLGAKDSFMEAIINAPLAEYYALSDQDDVWDKDKLISAIKKIQIYSETKPCLYCGRTRLVNESLENIDKRGMVLYPERQFLRGEFPNVAGCTMVFNKVLQEMIKRYHPIVYPMHDAWIKYVCSALDGIIIYDSVPHISYRQHNSNAVGGSRDLLSSIKRRVLFYKKMGKQYHKKMFMELLNTYGEFMSQKNKDICRFVCSYDLSIKNKCALLNFSEFWQGSTKYKIETLILVLTNYY